MQRSPNERRSLGKPSVFSSSRCFSLAAVVTCCPGQGLRLLTLEGPCRWSQQAGFREPWGLRWSTGGCGQGESEGLQGCDRAPARVSAMSSFPSACPLGQQRPRDGHCPPGTCVRAGDTPGTPFFHLRLSFWLLQWDGKGAADSSVGGDGGMRRAGCFGSPN